MVFDGPLGTILGFGTSGRSRNLILLVILALGIVSMPILHVSWLVDILLALILISCIRAVSINRRIAIVAWSLAAIPLIGLGFSAILPAFFDILSRILVIPFFVYAVVVLVSQLMRSSVAGHEELFGAASTYLLIGLTWAVIYILTESIEPGSFSFPDHDQGSGASLLYFSFITLVTVGYGEITPVTDVARSMAVSEAVMGALFLTMLVARLVGLYTTAQSKKADQEAGGKSVDS